MPELPEVETTRRGIAPYVLDSAIEKVIVRNRRLRWPVPRILHAILKQQQFIRLERRAKYLLFFTERGCMLLHLGMSGSLSIISRQVPPQKHDHIDFIFHSSWCLRFRDPRRFGFIRWINDDPYQDPLLLKLGLEPLVKAFDGHYLFMQSRHRCRPIKSFIMDAKIVTGIGNIYASEILFAAAINPKRAAGDISKQRYIRLASVIKQVLAAAIKRGGTTLRDFIHSDGRAGYFQNELKVYGHAGQPCPSCRATIRSIQIAGRSTFYCAHCQK